MDELEEQLLAVAGSYGEPLATHARGTLTAGGKRLRPLLLLLVAGERAAARAETLRAAVAVELLHVATLVHDDVLDRAPLRRGVPTVYATEGRELATATGDLLFSRAFAHLAENDDPEQISALAAASSALVRGELLQRADAFDASITAERYLLRCELKTARLFEAACEIGALAGGLGRESLQQFGRLIGVAFQILDDILDITGSVERTGKARGTDLLDGTVTLPLILAREQDPQLGQIELRGIGDSATAETLCDRIAATDGLKLARERALTYVSDAKTLLTTLPDEQHRALALVADGVVDRYS